MKIEEIRSLHVNLPTCQIRGGKALFVIEMFNAGRPTGRDVMFKTPTELRALIDGLVEVEKYFKQLETPLTPTTNV